MMINPDIQEKVQKEIDDLLAKNNGQITYEDIQKLKYLDMAASGCCFYIKHKISTFL